MKQLCSTVFLIALLISNQLLGQSNTFPSSGKVGIGTTSPSYRLDILVPAISGPEDILRLKVSDAPNDFLSFHNATGVNNIYIPSIKGFRASDNRPALFLGGEITSNNDNGNWGVVTFDAKSNGSFVTNRNLFIWRNYTNNLMALDPNGNLGIGTMSPTHKLEVNGTVRAKEVKLETTNWPDYVFEKDYQLMPLGEVKTFIEEKGHLPGLKSAKEYEAEGVDMMELNQRLLEKVEELTLHMIRQELLFKNYMEKLNSLEDRLTNSNN